QYSNKTMKVITVEDHFEQGGLGDFVSSALSTTGVLVYKMSVLKMPRSGNKDELLNYMGINASHIVTKVKEMLQ
ncbi:MAG: transketolase C-terminal domain-containing protein, partial [Patescibacteria group bacterium]